MRILIIDDDKYWSDFLRQGLTFEGFTVDVAGNGRTGIREAVEKAYSTILVDILMPELDGFTVVRKLRELNVRAGIIIVSCQGHERDKLRGFDFGADDYVVKPVSLAELVARMRSVQRRMDAPHCKQSDPNLLKVGRLYLHLLKREVRKDGRPIQLTKTEFDLLECFLRRPGQVLSRSVLAQQIVSGDFEIGTNLIDVHVKNIRNKIDDRAKESIIRTIRGIGYTLRL